MAHLAQNQFDRSAVASNQELDRWGSDYGLDPILLADPLDTLEDTLRATERARLMEMAHRPLGALVAQRTVEQ